MNLSPLQMLLLNLFHVSDTCQLIIKNEDILSYVGVHYCLWKGIFPLNYPLFGPPKQNENKIKFDRVSALEIDFFNIAYDELGFIYNL